MALAEHITASSWGFDGRPDFDLGGAGEWGRKSHKESKRQPHSLVHDVSMPSCLFFFKGRKGSLVRFIGQRLRGVFAGGRDLGEERKELGFGVVSL